MRIYTFIMAVFVSLLINIILNVRIFMHVRASIRRIQPQTIGINTEGDNNQYPQIRRREISLLRQMIFMFSMFMGGWTPIYSILIINEYIHTDPLILQCSIIVGELTVLAIIINLFVCNYQIRRYLINKIRQYIRC